MARKVPAAGVGGTVTATSQQLDPIRADLASLHLDVIAHILHLLRPEDICHLATCCSSLKAHAYDEQRIWRLLCEQHYGCHTCVSSWLQPTGPGPRLYRELYPVLASHAKYVGLWHAAAPSGPKGALYSFRWAADGVDVVQLVPTHRSLTQTAHKRFCTLGPANSRYQAVVLDGSKCVLRDYGSNHRGPASPCPVAEAAASVAVGGPYTAGRRSSSGGSSSSSSSSSVQEASAGGSPSSASGFWYELSRFMQSSVQKTRSSRRNRRAGSESPPLIFHFSRVHGPLRAPANKNHPHQLAGIYKGLYGPHGCEMMAVSYDFSQRSARIVATKLTGDVNVPAGKVTWQASAAALPTPWPAAEQHLVDLRPQMVAATAATAVHLAEIEAEDDAAGNVIAALMQEEEPPAHAVQALQQQQQGDAAAAAAAAEGDGILDGGIAGFAIHQAQAQVAKIEAWAVAMQARKVAAIYTGQGQIAQRGFQEPSWVEGRLWVYEDGSCGFVFMMAPHVYHLIDLERCDADL